MDNSIDYDLNDSIVYTKFHALLMEDVMNQNMCANSCFVVYIIIVWRFNDLYKLNLRRVSNIGEKFRYCTYSEARDIPQVE